MNLEFKKEMTDRIDLQQLMLDDEFLKSSRKLYLDEFEDEDIWWLNDESKQMLNRGYLLRGERVLDAIERVCKSAAKKYRGSLIDEHVAYKHFVRNVLLGWQSFSSPVWSNMGVSRGLPISCFGIYAGDSVESITDKLGEVILQTKLGGGTSGYFGELRGRGTEVKDNGKSSGAVSFMQMFDKAMEVVSQGGVRRGNFAAYLDIDHPDIEEFLQIKDIGSPIQNLFTGVSIPDWWMNDMFYGKDIAKRKIWAKILESRQEKGLPYILFSDAINRGKPDIYKELKLKIYASNLCFSGDTIIAIADGTNGKTIKELAEFSQGKIKFPVYCATDKLQRNIIGKANGGVIKNYNWKSEIKNAVAFKTGTKKVIEITLSNGDKFKCTDNHELALKSGGYIEASKSLNKELESFFTFTEQNNKSKYRHINSKSNATKKQHLMIWDFYNDAKHDIIDHKENNLEYPDVIKNLQTLTKDAHKSKTYKERTGLNNTIHKLNDKKTWRHNVSVGATGLNNSNSNSLSSLEIIIKCQEYMTKNNINKMTSKLQEDLSNNELSGILPKSFSKNRFKGSRKYFRDCVNGLVNLQTTELDVIPEKIKSDILNKFDEIKQNRFNYIDKHFYEYKNNDIYLKGLFVVSIEECGEEDVYDLTVEDNHNFYIITSTQDKNYENCQGILVHNCSEIALPSSIDESFVCCLSSMNLELYDEWKDSDAIYWAILFLDAVMTEFIDKTEGVKYLEQSHNFAKRHRALGLGVMGYHSYLQKNMIAFDDWEATQFNAKVFKQIYTEAKEASIELVEIFGPAPIFNELNNKEDMEDVVTNMRNTTLIAIAPTTSSSSILSQASPGIEPYSSNYFKAGLAKGNFMRANKYLKQLLIDKDKDDEEVWRSIMLAHGSVQHLDFLSAHEKNVFKTFKEISPAELISKAAQRQQYIDQMQSLNLLIPAIMDIKDVNLLYKQAWESGVKSLYYQRSSSVSKEMMTNFVTCQACEA